MRTLAVTPQSDSVKLQEKYWVLTKTLIILMMTFPIRVVAEEKDNGKVKQKLSAGCQPSFPLG